MSKMSGSILIEEAGEDYILRLDGTIDENCPFPEKLPQVGQRLIIDCGGVYMVTSIGINQWMKWIRSLKVEQQVVFRNCTRKVIDIMNYLESFLSENSVIESFYVPYECDNCGHEYDELFRRGKDYLESAKGRVLESRIPETMNCQKCGEEMETAVLLQNYLRFLNAYNASEK